LKKSYGFSLVELLTVIVILGLIVIIALPVYDNVKEKTNLKTMLSQENLLKLAGEDYLLSNRELFPKNIGESYSITLSVLIDEGFIKPIYDVNGDACDTELSTVSAYKNNPGVYKYSVYLKCPGYITE